jgi:hypothetical protein
MMLAFATGVAYGGGMTTTRTQPAPLFLALAPVANRPGIYAWVADEGTEDGRWACGLVRAETGEVKVWGDATPAAYLEDPQAEAELIAAEAARAAGPDLRWLPLAD